MSFATEVTPPATKAKSSIAGDKSAVAEDTVAVAEDTSAISQDKPPPAGAISHVAADTPRISQVTSRAAASASLNEPLPNPPCDLGGGRFRYFHGILPIATHPELPASQLPDQLNPNGLPPAFLQTDPNIRLQPRHDT